MPNRPLHLLIISNTESPIYIQGADRDWVNLLNALGPERVRVSWVGISGTEMLRQYLHSRVATKFIDLTFSPFYELFHQSMYRRRSSRRWMTIIGRSIKDLRRPLVTLRRIMRNDLPDLVVSNSSVVLIGAAYAFLTRLPHLWSVKEFLDPAVKDCIRYARLIEKFSDMVSIPSQAMSMPFRRFRVLHDGNDLKAIQASAAKVSREEVLRSLDLPINQPVVAQIGALSWAKGQHITARACTQVASEANTCCSILFLGQGTVDEKEKLRSLLADTPLRMQASIRFLEYDADEFSYLSAADVVVHPSLLPDPYPNAIREAMVLGKAVIGSRSGGIPELITDGETGLLVEPGDILELANALQHLLAFPAKRARMGDEARRFAATTLDINIRKEAFFTAFCEILHQRSSEARFGQP